MISLGIVPLLLLLGGVQSAKVLIFHGVAGYSHRVQTWPIAVALSKRGHEVSYITPVGSKVPNPKISELVPPGLTGFVDYFHNEFDITPRINNDLKPMHEILWDLALGLCDATLNDQQFKEWFNSDRNKKFDLFIIDNSFAQCATGLAHVVGAKVILFDTLVPSFAYNHDMLGLTPESSAIPELEHYPYKVPMSFFDRVGNTMTSLIWHYKHQPHLEKLDGVIRNALNATTMPFIGDLIGKVNLVFHTGDVVSDFPRALPPLVVNVAGAHCYESNEPLPKEMEKFIKSEINGKPSDGFIYISLGSFLTPAKLPERTRQVFLDAIRSLPNIRFLWSWKDEPLKNAPENLLFSKWFQQVDVLSHKKILGFVTQTGRPSMLEALNLGVPMITFPVMGDQDNNANRLEEMGANVNIEIATVTTDELKRAFEKVAYNSEIKLRMKKLQNIFRDRPMSAVDTAVWWAEYVLRHENTDHLRPAGHKQAWFVRRGADVWAFISVSLFSIFITGAIVLGKAIMIVKGMQKKVKKE